MLLNSNLNEDSSPLINQAPSSHSQSITINTELDRENLNPEQKEKYDKLQKTYSLFEWVYLASILFFQMMFLSLFVYLTFGFIRLTILVFAFATIFSLVALLNIYVKLKVMLDTLKDSKNQNISLGIIVSYLCVNLGGLSVLIYLVLLSIKIYAQEFLSWSIVSIPLYFTISLMVLYCLFLLPVMLMNKQWLDIFLVFDSLLCLLVFLILLNSKLDNTKFELSWSILCFPIHFGFLVYLFYLSTNYFYLTEPEKQQQRLSIVLQLLSILLFVNGVAYMASQLSNDEQINNIPSITILASSICFSIDKMISLYATDDDESEKSNPSKKL